jgi:hypothetical protein
MVLVQTDLPFSWYVLKYLKEVDIMKLFTEFLILNVHL